MAYMAGLPACAGRPGCLLLQVFAGAAEDNLQRLVHVAHQFWRWYPPVLISSCVLQLQSSCDSFPPGSAEQSADQQVRG
jgi:hypothetical protein